MGFPVSELSKMLIDETYYYTFHPYFRLEKLQLHYMDCDSFVLSTRTQKIINDLKNLGDLFEFSNLDKNHELFSKKKTKKLLVKLKLKLQKKFGLTNSFL